jgi:hypothetical protein
VNRILIFLYVVLFNKLQRMKRRVSLGLSLSKCGGAAFGFLVYPLTHQVLFTLRLNPCKQVRFVFSRSGNEIHQKCMEGVCIQLVNSAQSLFDGRYIRLNFGFGLDPLSWILRDSLCVNDGVLLMYKIQ